MEARYEINDGEREAILMGIGVVIVPGHIGLWRKIPMGATSVTGHATLHGLQPKASI